MALDDYGVLAARALDTEREDGTDTPHYQLHLVDDAGEHWRIAVNVESQQAPSELLYLVDDDFRHPVTALLEPLASGWHPLAPGADGPHLDYIRGNLFDRARMRLLPPALEGPDNDLADLLDGWAARAVADAAATVFAFGQRFGPEAGVADKVFGFTPANGVHDIHMNQGNAGPLRAGQRRAPGRRAARALPAAVALGGDLPRLPEPVLSHRRHDRAPARCTARRGRRGRADRRGAGQPRGPRSRGGERAAAQRLPGGGRSHRLADRRPRSPELPDSPVHPDRSGPARRGAPR